MRVHLSDLDYPDDPVLAGSKTSGCECTFRCGEVPLILNPTERYLLCVVFILSSLEGGIRYCSSNQITRVTAATNT